MTEESRTELRPSTDGGLADSKTGMRGRGNLKLAALTVIGGVAIVKCGGKTLFKSADNIPYRQLSDLPSPRPSPGQGALDSVPGQTPIYTADQLSDVVPWGSMENGTESFTRGGLATPRHIESELRALPRVVEYSEPLYQVGKALHEGIRGERLSKALRGSDSDRGSQESPSERAVSRSIPAWARTREFISIALEAGYSTSMVGVSTENGLEYHTWGSSENGISSIPYVHGSAADEGRRPNEDAFICDVALGDHHGVAIVMMRAARALDFSRAQVVAWGASGHGRCSVPSALCGAVAVERLAAGASHSIALDTSGLVYCWGDNRQRQCEPPPIMGRACEIAAGGDASFAISRTGRIWAWGDDTHGQCSGASRIGLVRAIDGGARHAVAIGQDGRVRGWGDDSQGQCALPAAVDEPLNVSAGGAHTLLLQTGGVVIAFGSNACGQCDIPALAGGDRFIAVSAGFDHSLGLTSAGQVVAWGSNALGQCTVPKSIAVSASSEASRQAADLLHAARSSAGAK